MEPKLKIAFEAHFASLFATMRKSLPLAAVALALMSLSVLAACGGGNGDGSDDGGTSAPATAPPAATQTPEAAPVAPTTGSGSETVFVRARGFEVMELNLAAGDNVSLSYSSLGRSSGGITEGGDFASGDEGAGSAASDVILTVLNPVEDQLLSTERAANNSVDFQADIDGVYQLVFTNPYLLQGVEVTIEFTINP